MNWPLKRAGFHCRCDLCLARCGPIQRKLGKFWQAKYGESAKDFRKRLESEHRRMRA